MRGLQMPGVCLQMCGDGRGVIAIAWWECECQYGRDASADAGSATNARSVIGVFGSSCRSETGTVSCEFVGLGEFPRGCVCGGMHGGCGTFRKKRTGRNSGELVEST